MRPHQLQEGIFTVRTSVIMTTFASDAFCLLYAFALGISGSVSRLAFYDAFFGRLVRPHSA